MHHYTFPLFFTITCLYWDTAISWTKTVLFPSRRHLVVVVHSLACCAFEEKHGGILYRTSVFNKEEYAAITEDVNRAMGQLSEESSLSVAKHRLGTVLSPTSRAYPIFREGSLQKLVQQVTSEDYELSKHVPIEIRSYERRGACMAWHSDDILYCDPPQIEVVWTFENSSDCQTMWKTENGKVESVETEKNSAILLRAGGPAHCVTSLKRGKRVIIKCVYAAKHATFVSQSKDAAQFEELKVKKSRKRKKR